MGPTISGPLSHKKFLPTANPDGPTGAQNLCDMCWLYIGIGMDGDACGNPRCCVALRSHSLKIQPCCALLRLALTWTKCINVILLVSSRLVIFMGVFWSVISKILKMTSFFWASPIARPISDLIEGMAAASLSFGPTNHIHQPPERLAPEVRIAMCLWYTYDIHMIYI